LKILGLTLNETSTAALMVDGKVVACVSEERFTRKKNDMGYPKNSVDFCLDYTGISANELDAIVIGTKELDPSELATKKQASFSIDDYVREQREYWYPVLYKGEKMKFTSIFKDKLDFKQYGSGWEKIPYDTPEAASLFIDFIKNIIADHLKVSKDKIICVDHHTAHAYYAYFASPFRDEKCLIFTIDGYGDGLNGTVSAAVNNKIKRIHEYDNLYIGRLYRYITLLLGMKPNEHEYKVMGLAPYAKPEIYKKPYEIFKNTMYFNGKSFKYHEKPKDAYFYFKDKLEGCRFDGIAGGLQLYVEEVLVEWVRSIIKETGITKLVFGGGVAMNIKAMQRIHEMEEVEDLFVPASPGDDSLAMGACYLVAVQNKENAEPLKNVYLGPQFTTEFIEAFIKKHKLDKKYKIKRGVAPKDIAKKLAKKYVVAVMHGRMEFGARALGNRSILANPHDFDMVEKINRKIKNRDFWMPFAPAILEEAAHEYLINPKNIKSPFMTIGFNTTQTAREKIPAALHPADKTVRPQIVNRKASPYFHEIISEFRRITGIGAVLNTSFNLHGEPIVCSPEDALHVFENSDLDMLVIEDFMFTKNKSE